jgi:hypothetical protein
VLSLEVRPFNIKVISLDIGFVQTAVLDKVVFEPCPIEDYAPALKTLTDTVGSMMGKMPGDPDRCAEAIIQAVQKVDKNFSLVPLGSDSIATIREYAKYLEASCQEWEDVAKSVDQDGPKQGWFTNVSQYLLLD